MILRKNQVPAERAERETFGVSDTVRLSAAGGLSQYGAYVQVLHPGARSSNNHWHENEDEFLYVLSGEGDQMLDDGGENWFPVRVGDTIYVPTAMFHATINTGWEPMRLLAIYNPGGAERVLRDLPDFREGDGPEWSVSA